MRAPCSGQIGVSSAVGAVKGRGGRTMTADPLCSCSSLKWLCEGCEWHVCDLLPCPLAGTIHMQPLRRTGGPCPWPGTDAKHFTIT